MSEKYSIITSTFPDTESAKNAAKQLVEKRLAACVQLFPIGSVYMWKGDVCDEGEIMLLIKSKTELFDQIAAEITKLHTYEVPEIVQLLITGGLPEYLQWIDDCTRGMNDY